MSGGAAAPGGTASGRGAAAEALALLERRGQTVAVAESLTGGLVAAELTAVDGASRSFRGSVTAYATDLKHRLLGVDAALLAERGAVDPEVARQMARGVRRALGADWGVATTGVAGPTPQDGQPVGTVHVAVAGPSGRMAGAAHRFEGDRAGIRAHSVRAAVKLLLSELIATAGAQDTEQYGGI
ncbi:CinA family protein [Streptomyces sp. NPDC005393]|uniref:CinA family protein n=1 Tax=Streptomyces sp. NPDC005393 TaxID=3157041 RepID=UPI0033B02E00